MNPNQLVSILALLADLHAQIATQGQQIAELQAADQDGEGE